MPPPKLKSKHCLMSIGSGVKVCRGCSGRWPCDTAVMQIALDAALAAGEALATRVRALEAGLAWYADEKHYDAYGAEISPADQDAGAIARAALTGEG